MEPELTGGYGPKAPNQISFHFALDQRLGGRQIIRRGMQVLRSERLKR